MKHIKLYNSAAEAIGTSETTPLIASIKNVKKAMFASKAKFGDTVQIVEDGPDFIKGLAALAFDANGHEYVDLGLPSGTLWAKCNIGSEAGDGTAFEEVAGWYFAWGDTRRKTLSSIQNDCKYYNSSGNSYTKYNLTDGITVLSDSDDIARLQWGGDWYMPTSQQLQELLDNTVMVEQTSNGHVGIRFTSSINENSIFIPFSGQMINNSVQSDESTISLWAKDKSNVSDRIANALFIYPDMEMCAIDNMLRYYGMNIRPVILP